ncbi:MAG: hypothetical protein MJ176_02990, partial [Treponema sp.]|nr:hypothetical protein [Treponema sp.]
RRQKTEDRRQKTEDRRQKNYQEKNNSVKGIRTCILKDIGTSFDRFTDVAITLQARDWKGFNNYGSNGVIEIYELDGN